MGGRNGCNDSEEMNRLKSHCSAKGSIYALLMVHCLSLLFRHGYAYVPNPYLKQLKRIIRYTKSLTLSPTAAITNAEVLIATGLRLFPKMFEEIAYKVVGAGLWLVRSSALCQNHSKLITVTYLIVVIQIQHVPLRGDLLSTFQSFPALKVSEHWLRVSPRPALNTQATLSS